MLQLKTEKYYHLGILKDFEKVVWPITVKLLCAVASYSFNKCHLTIWRQIGKALKKHICNIVKKRSCLFLQRKKFKSLHSLPTY